MADDFDAVLGKSGVGRSRGYDFYHREYLLEGVDCSNSIVCDLGGGNGVASFYLAKEFDGVTCYVIDPLSEGSNTMMMEQYRSLKSHYPNSNVELIPKLLDEVEEPSKFDVILMLNCINHIGEDLLRKESLDEEDYDLYQGRMADILSRLKSGGTLVVSDCSNNNFWGNLGIKNPTAPSIEWHIHRPPEFWREMLEGIGARHIRTKRTARLEFGQFGKLFLANRFCSFLLDSGFVSQYSKS